MEEAENSNSEAKRRQKEAHILNIHEDPVLSKAICYFFPWQQTTTFGNRNRLSFVHKSTLCHPLRHHRMTQTADHTPVPSDDEAVQRGNTQTNHVSPLKQRCSCRPPCSKPLL